MRGNRLVLVLLVAATSLAPPVRAALKDPDFGARQNAFRKAVRPGPKGELPPVDPSLEAVRAFAGTRDARVLKDLFQALPPLLRLAGKASEDLQEATEKLAQVQQPEFRRQEDYYRKNGKFPDTILIVTKEALETLGAKQREAAAAYDEWVRLREAVRAGFAQHLAALAEERDEVWNSAVKLGTNGREPELRIAFTASLRDIPGRDVDRVLLDIEASETDPAVLVVALEVLGRRPTPEGFERIRKRLADPRWEVSVAAIHALARFRGPETVPALVERLATAEGRIVLDVCEALFDITGKHLPDSHEAWRAWWSTEKDAFLPRWSPDKAVRLKAIEEIGFTDPKEIDVAAELAALLPGEPDPEVRSEILDNLAIHRSNLARETLLRALEDPDRELRLAAIRGLAHYRHLAVPAALIRRVEVADPDELLAIFQALRTLWGGGDEFTVRTADREAILRWWGNNKDRVGRHFLQLGAQDIAAGRTEPAEIEGAWMDRNFYGLRVMSKRVIFVFDISLSMEEPAVEGKETRKIDVAKAELRRVIPALPDDASFGMIGFSGLAEVWEGAMMAASPANRKRAVEWVDGLETKAATNIFDTLELCFRVGRPGAGAGDVEPDTIFFVSDGAPTVGKFIDASTILQYVRRWNEGRGLRIHCIGVGHDHDVDFLRKLAEENRGHYVAR